MRFGGKQLLLIFLAALFTVILYFAPQKVKQEEGSKKQTEDAFSLKNLSKEAKGQLKRQEVERISVVEDALEKDPTSLELTDSLGKMWDRVNMPYIAAHYYELIAISNPNEANWINAAYRYYDAFRMVADSTLKGIFVDKAIQSYKKVLEINPSNLNAKSDLGLCYAEGTTSPMQGITLLREVVQENPEHEMAQFNLGVLSVKSGQYDKAVERFEKVLKINGANKEARFLLGKTYSLMGKNDLAIKSLQPLKNSGDERLNQEVNILINQINNN